MDNKVKNLKVRVGIGTVGMAILFVAVSISFASAFKLVIAGDSRLLFNVVMFPAMLGFLLSGYCQIITTKLGALVDIAQEANDGALKAYLSTISITSRLPLLVSLASLVSTAVIANTHLDGILELELFRLSIFFLAQSLSLLIIATVLRKTLLTNAKK
ncbi:hypothetical protein LMH73_027340 [Vibrio splendidus]|nr:hypothetical protein [Vibrio splendidus]MCC4880392.1 hypothetical protein [Vibrio splendidus]